jgi:hypothetical protein
MLRGRMADGPPSWVRELQEVARALLPGAHGEGEGEFRQAHGRRLRAGHCKHPLSRHRQALRGSIVWPWKLVGALRASVTDLERKIGSRKGVLLGLKKLDVLG